MKKIFFAVMLMTAPVCFAMSSATQEQPAIQQALLHLEEYGKEQFSLNVQNPDLSYAMRKAIVIAELLIQADGTLDLGSVNNIEAAFISKNPEEYEQNMVHFLNQLGPNWNSFFATVQAPTDSLAQLTLRAFFSLKQSDPVTDRHAKIAVLSALLAPYNQGPVGDCFAVNDVIRDHKEYFLHAAEDYRSITMLGLIERSVNGVTDGFFYVPNLADDDLSQPFTLTQTGAFQNGQSLFDAPGFAAAFNLMGAKLGVSDVLVNLSNLSEVTPSIVLRAMANATAAITSADPNALYNLGAYAFSSLTNNPVLRAVEAAFAAMAEDRTDDSTRGNINDCVAQSLTSVWKHLSVIPGATDFQKTFTASLNSSYRLLYNLNIPLAVVSADGSSTDGGFQLYKRQDATHLGTRVATPQDFRALILNAITAAENAVSSSNANAASIAATLTSYVETDDFLKNALWDYDSSNRSEPNPIQNYQKLSRTPMQSCDGDNPFEVDDIDTETSYDQNVQSFTAKNTNDLIIWALNLAKIAPKELIPMDSPQHAFNFVPTNPDIVAFLQKTMTPAQWIQKRLVIPGLLVSRQKITAATVKSLSELLASQLSDVLTDLTAYENLVKTLQVKQLSIKDFATGLFNGVVSLLELNAPDANQLAIALDAILLQVLPQNDQAILEAAAVRFAFTNWNQGTKDIYFCAYFNPRTEQVGFGTIFEDKTQLQPMDEDAWVNNQTWDVDLKPYAPK